ncbi:MAG: TIGR04290 family methyltransferase [Alphaproteobacteria bacterium]
MSLTQQQQDDAVREIAALGPWFHNLHLPNGLRTAPDHRFGDFPHCKWQELKPYLPESLDGRRVLDIGCNAGFYTFALAKMGASVVGIDDDPHYLRQAEWARNHIGAERVRFRRQQVYDLARTTEHFDVVVFMGVFYHLRYPLLALDIIAGLRPDMLIFQTLTADVGDIGADPKQPLDFDNRKQLTERDWPFMAFIEGDFAGDPTNWWAPNHAAVCALLRAVGYRVTARPGHEIYVCRRDSAFSLHAANLRQYQSATAKRTESWRI